MNQDDVEARLTAIESRLSRIEGRGQASAKLFGDAGAPPAPAPAPAPTVAPVAVPAPRPVAARIAPEFAASNSAAKPGGWLGVIAIVCFILAAGFIVKLSIDAGWLTPERQIGLTALLGLALIGVGFALMDRDREYAAFLPAGGIVILHLANFAAHGQFGYEQTTSLEVALAVSAIISGACVWLYTEIEHDLYAVTAAVGAYAAPILLGLTADADFTLLYIVACSLAFATISIWAESRLLTLIAAYAALFATEIVGQRLPLDATVAIMLAINFVIFAVGTFTHTKHSGQPLTPNESASFLPVMLLFYALEYSYISRAHPGWAPYVSLGFAALLLALSVLARAQFPDRVVASRAVITTFLTVVVFHSFYLEILPASIHPWLLPALVLAATFAPNASTHRRDPALVVPLIALGFVLGIEFLSMAFRLLTRPSPDLVVAALAAFAALWVNLIRGDDTRKRDEHHLVLGAAHTLAVLGFFRLTEGAGSLAVSCSWLLYAIAVIAFAFTRRDVIMAKSAIFVLSFAAAKALLYDAAAAPAGVRIVCLLVTGAVLYGSGFIIRRISAWSTEAPPRP